MRRLRVRARDERGATAITFALIAPAVTTFVQTDIVSRL